jgi:hypothetical protein
MADRNLDGGRNFGKGMVYLDFSFLANAGSDPTAASFRGTPLADVVKSVTYAATGKYTVVLKDKWRYIVSKYADLEDVTVPDGGYASIGNVSGEGAGPLTFVISTFSAAGTLTQFTGRRVSCSLVLKNSTVGV